MTATRAAEVTRGERDNATWLWGGIVATIVILAAAAAGARWAQSVGVEREARARGYEAEAHARAFAVQIEAQRASTIVQLAGGRMYVILGGAITEERLLEPAPVTPPEIIEQPAPRPANAAPEYADAMQFLEDAIILRQQLQTQSPADWPANRLPGAAHFAAAGVARWSNGSTWQRMVDGMNGAFVGTPRGTFANRERGYKAIRDVYAGLRRRIAENMHAAHMPHQEK
jgi:hypothetical protein